MAQLNLGTLKFWKHTASGLFEQKVRSVEEAMLLGHVLNEYDSKAKVEKFTYEGPAYGLKILDDDKKDVNKLSWKEWKDSRNRSISSVVRDDGIPDGAYLVELGDPGTFQVTQTERIEWFSKVIHLVLTKEGLPEVLNIYRGNLAIAEKKILGAAGWRLDFMTNWEVSWYIAMTEALKVSM